MRCETRIGLTWLIVVAAGLPALVLPGCPPRRDDPAAPTFRSVTPDEPAADNGGNPGQIVLLVRLKLTVIKVPLGTASSSEEIWSYLDEERVHAIRSAGLGRNGFRVGVGRKDTWKDLAKTLERMTAHKIGESVFSSPPGRPVPIVLKTAQPVQMIFISHDDRTLSGEDYPPGENLLLLDFTIDPNERSRILITAVPQIRTTKRKTHYVKTPSGYTVINRPTLFALSQITFRIAVAKGEFLVIGPSAEARRPTSAGHHFLVGKKKGLEYENVLILAPEVLAARIPSPRD